MKNQLYSIEAPEAVLNESYLFYHADAHTMYDFHYGIDAGLGVADDVLSNDITDKGWKLKSLSEAHNCAVWSCIIFERVFGFIDFTDVLDEANFASKDLLDFGYFAIRNNGIAYFDSLERSYIRLINAMSAEYCMKLNQKVNDFAKRIF